MLYKKDFYTVESVTSGHPDKVCDQVSDAIVDACLSEDPLSRVAVNAFGSHGLFVVGGEVTTKARVDYENIARKVYKDIGYDSDLKVIVHVAEQSPDISQGVDAGGAGEQGIMYGYATDETSEFLPKGIVLAHALARGLEDVRKSGEIEWLQPDGKSQVTIVDGKIKTILISCQHSDYVTQEEIQSVLIQKLISKLVEDASNIEILVNPTGKFVQGGFDADTGLTGRKIMVDTYGGLITHGGGAFSGKDPTKVDRSAAYMARFVAKNLVAQGLAKECFISVAYAIGRAEPLMIYAINEKNDNFSGYVKSHYDFRPSAIIERLGLRKPIFQNTATYGHFGKDGLPWEAIIQ